MRLKIPGGTVSDGQASLCNTCRSATIIRGSRLSDEIIACGKRIISDRITFPVAYCTGYSERETLPPSRVALRRTRKACLHISGGSDGGP